jgi:hypothetical protein
MVLPMQHSNQERENSMSQQLVDAAKALTVAYGKKDWEAIEASVSKSPFRG